MKRATALACVLALCVCLAACGGKDKPQPTPSAPVTGVPQTGVPETGIPETGDPAQSGPRPGAQPRADVTQTVAYYFPNVGGVPMLYAAAEVSNTGGTPVTVSQITFDFMIGGSSLSKAMQPVFYDADVIPAGGKAHFCIWTNYEMKADKSGAVTASANIEYAAADASFGDLSLSNLRVIQNYPGFATLSGLISNDSAEYDCGYSINYTAFYDSADRLLGVWYFTKDAALNAASRRDFVAHMQSLPIPGLADNCAKVTGRSIGVE